MSYLFGTTPASYIQVGAFDEERTVLSRPEWSYKNRAFHLAKAADQFVDLWPASRISAGDPTSQASCLGQDSGHGGAWGPVEAGSIGRGGPTTFLSGQTVDINSNPLSGVTVRGFVTSNNLYIGSTTSDANGNFSLGSPYPGVNHDLVAYLVGSPDTAGTTVNTLVPA